MNLAITVPTYNEAANIKKLVPAIYESLENYPGLRCTLFVIDDNSPDGTATIATTLAKKYRRPSFRIEIINRVKKEGLGKAYIDAFQQIIKSEHYDYILQMDADLSHDPKYLPAFLAATKKASFVVGSRYITGGGTPDWSINRRLLSKFGNIYTRLFLGSRIHDYTGGFNLFSTELMRKLNLESLEASGYGFLIELKYRALRQTAYVHEVPIIFLDRLHGTLKIPKNTLFKNLLLVPKIRIEQVGRRRVIKNGEISAILNSK